MVDESWREIADFPGYQVSDQGRVRNSRTGHILKPVWGGRRDPRNAVGLYRGGKQIKIHVARLVLTAFVRPPEPGEMALHDQDDLGTDRLDRLRWGRHHDNVEEARAGNRYRSPRHWTGRRLSRQHKAKLRAALKGRKRPPEVVATLGAGSARAWRDPNHRAQMLALHLGSKRSEKSRKKMRAAQRARRRRERLQRSPE